MPTALFLSPHLDDVAFSCGGTLLRLAKAGWRTVLGTIFTASVPEPQGFALRCQTDKGLPPSADYMAIRREEDHAFAALAGCTEVRHWPHREAPHRGYESPEALFAGPLPGDTVWESVRDDLASLFDTARPELIFAPQGLGRHVDHLQTIRALLAVCAVERVCWYRDTPYAIRDPGAAPAPALAAADLITCRVTLPAETLADKIAGCTLYASQIGFQFGGADGVRSKLTGFHRSEAGGTESSAESFLAHRDLHPLLPA